MGAPISLLNQARAMARDYPRDAMPRGYLWDVADYVPLIIDAPLTGRGAWEWGSGVHGSDTESGILAGFTTGDQLLIQDTGAEIIQVNPDPPYDTIIYRGTGPRAIQNPVQLRDDAVHCDGSGARQPQLWRSASIVDAYAGMGNSRVATTYNSMLVHGGAPGTENIVRLSVPGQDLASATSYDPNSFYPTSQRVTALAALRSVILVFHPGSVERIRGSIPAASPDQKGDMFVEKLFDRVGCQDPRSIAYWNDNCVFADEHGVHMTDGATIRNLISQGGMLYYWRQLQTNKLSMSACTFLDFYMISIRLSSGPAITLVCDLNRRQWFRFTNVSALTLISSSGSRAMERIWGGIEGTNRLARLGPMFFPVSAPITTVVTDANGTVVLPSFETPWYRLTDEGRKRVRFVYLSYDARASEVDSVLELSYITSPQNSTYTVAGALPPGNEYDRFRLPVGKLCYGIAFHVRQTQGTEVLRIFDLAVEAQAVERSRV